MRTVGVYLIFGAVVLRTAVVGWLEPEFPVVMTLLTGYGVLLFGKTWLMYRAPSHYLPSSRTQLTYLFLQSVLAIEVLIVSSYEDFLAMLFIPLSLDAVAFFGRWVGYMVISIFSAAMIATLLFSDTGLVFGLVMGILYSAISFLFGGYAYQVQKAKAAKDQNIQMFNALQSTHDQLQGYTDQKANLAIEQERNRLARELHDSVTQTVFSMNLAAQSARLLFEKEPLHTATQLLHLEDLGANALREIQSLVSQLKPRSIIQEGLPTALRELAFEQKTRNGLNIQLEIHGERILSERVATRLYAIAQEALMNVSKHSGACEAVLRLNLVKDHSSLEIEDRGRGFQPDAALDKRGHLGLTGMLERAREIGWSVSVSSRPGQGTRICTRENPPGVNA